MKVVYNWLKDFVDVTAPPQELASRLALSGTNIGGVENGAHGAVIEAEVSSNRPDCLGHLGIAREVGAILQTARGLHSSEARGKCVRQSQRRHSKSKSNRPNSAAASPRASFET